MILYGIKNCDTVKKARKWLDEHAIPYTFHDFRQDGLDRATLERLEGTIGWETMLNRRGTTWRKLAEEEKADLDRDKALALMLAHPTLIKRPVVEDNGTARIGINLQS